MTRENQGLTWEEVIHDAGALPQDQTGKPFVERAAEAETWAKALATAPAGRPIMRMGRPAKAGT